MHSLMWQAFDSISGEWQLNLESRVPPQELHQSRINSSKPSLGFFVLLICSAVIATLGLISNSTTVVIGAMIVAPLIDPILSLAFVLTISDNRLVKPSAITVVIGVLTVVGTSWVLASVFEASEVNREMTSRTAPNLIDLVIAVAAAVAGAFTLSRDRLSNSIRGVAIAVAPWQLAKSMAQLVALAQPSRAALHPALISAARLQCAATNQRAICDLQSQLDRERSQRRNGSGQFEASQIALQQRSRG